MKRLLSHMLVSAAVVSLCCGVALADGARVITTDSVNVRKQPDKNSAVVTEMNGNSSAEYLGETKTDSRGVDWYYVRTKKGNVGWVSSKYSYISGVAKDTATGSGDASSTASQVRVNKDTKVRSQPSLDGNELTVLYSGASVDYLGKTETDGRGVDWYYVDANGSTNGWVSSKNTTLINGGTSTSGEGLSLIDVAGQLASDLSQDGTVYSTGNGQQYTGTEYDPSATYIDLEPYYGTDLQTAAAELGLTDYRYDDSSEVPNQYSLNGTTIAGNNLAEGFEIYGSGYSICGAAVGMDIDTAIDLLESAGMDLNYTNSNTYTFEHKKNGIFDWCEGDYDGCVNVYVSGGIVTGIDQSTYTG